MRQNQHLRHNQSGMTALVVTMILMIVISLIVVGFSATTRREQRQALDYNLASQAFYAAESGVNMAMNKLKTNPTMTKDTCDATEHGIWQQQDYKLDTNNNVAITCILIDSSVDSIVLDPVGMNSKVQKINTNGTPLNTIQLSWQQKSGNGSFASCTGATLPPAPSCPTPVLRVDIVNIKNGVGLTRANLQTSQFSAFFRPSTTAAYSCATNCIAYSSAQKGSSGFGQIKLVKCDNAQTLRCSIDVQLPGFPATTVDQYAIRVMALYGDTGEATVNIAAKNGNTVIPLTGAQAVVDVTAKAQDVLKRVQARVKLSGGGTDTPDFAIGVDGDICKKFQVHKSGTIDYSCDVEL